MRRLLLLAATFSALSLGAAHAITVTDPVGDFLPSFVGTHDLDLDVTSFTVTFNSAASDFLLSATLAGVIDPSKTGFYVIGANTGTGPSHPFASIGAPNVIFNQAIVVQKSGTAAVSGHALNATIAGDSFSVIVPLSFLPSTGFAPDNYGFNLWPRNGSGNNNQISDFAPDNANIAAVPEPGAWALLVVGLGMVGGAMRRRASGTAVAA